MNDERVGSGSWAVLFCALMIVGSPGFAGPDHPSAEVRSSRVSFASGEITLAGLMFEPSRAGPHPAVVLLPGSLPTKKDDERLVNVATAFAREGFLALTTDSRGTGESGGAFSAATFDVLAADADAAMDWLRQRADVRSDSVGLWGVSQGASWVGPLAAKRSDAAFLVAVSGPLVSPEAHTRGILDKRLREQGNLDDVALQRITELRATIWSYYASGDGYETTSAEISKAVENPWFETSGLPRVVREPQALGDLPPGTITFLSQKDFDPLKALARLQCPVLAVYGSLDDHLSVSENVAKLEELASRTGVEITIEVVPKTDHDLLPVPSAGEGAPTKAEVWSLMARWAKGVVARSEHAAESPELCRHR